MPVYSSAGVYLQETDLSQVVSPVSASIGAIVGYTAKGPVNIPALITNTKLLKETFGNPDPSLSYSIYAALAFLQESRQLYFQRVIGGVWEAGGCLFQISGTGATQSYPSFYNNVSGSYDMSGTINTLPAANHLFWVEGMGPSASSNLLRVQVIGKNLLLNLPTVTTTGATTGGTLAAATYAVSVQAVSTAGTKAAPVAATPDITTTGATSSIGVTWTAATLSGSIAYFDIYVTTGSLTYKVTSVPISSPFSYTITALPVATVALPVAVTIDEFDLYVYDTAISSTVPQETYTVALGSRLDGFGQQMEIQQVVNTLKASKYIRVINNTTTLGVVNPVFSVASTALLSGLTTAPTASEVALAWGTFSDPDSYTVRILINAGYSNPTVQLAMNQVCMTRLDCFAILDMPTSAQATAQGCIDYRNVNLGLNSNRAAIYTPDLYVDDPENGQLLFVPPSGHVAGVYARTDYVTQAWFAPAGLNRGILNVRGVRYKYDQGSRDLLTPAQVNTIRSMPGRGTVVWEQVTLQSKTTALSYVNVRRLFDMLEITVRNALDFSLQEPNDPFLRRQIVQLIDEFLSAVKAGRGVLQYAVIADDSNNPGYLTGLGQLNVDIYVTPTLPAQKIKTQWIITKQGVQFGDLIALGGNF